MLSDEERRKKEFELTYLSNALHTTNTITVTLLTIAIASGAIIFTWGMESENTCEINHFLTPYFTVGHYTYFLTTSTLVVGLAVIITGYKFSKKLIDGIKELEDDLELEHRISQHGVLATNGVALIYAAIGAFSFLIAIFIIGGIGVCPN